MRVITNFSGKIAPFDRNPGISASLLLGRTNDSNAVEQRRLQNEQIVL